MSINSSSIVNIPLSVKEHHNINNKDKSHFFIGNIFDESIQIRQLVNLRKKLRNKYKLKEPHWNNKFFTNLIYLGYFDNITVNMYMENIITPLLVALSDKINVLNCNFTQFKIEFDKTFYKISLKINDENNLLENIIVPYLYDNAISPIYNKKKIMYKPSVDLLYYKSSSRLHSKNDISVQVPLDMFKIKHLSLIKGTPVKYRPGTPSLHDQMNIEEIFRYNIELRE